MDELCILFQDWVAFASLAIFCSRTYRGHKRPHGGTDWREIKIKLYSRNNHAGMFVWPKGIIWWWKSWGLRAPQIYVAKKQSLGIFLKIHYINLGALNPQLFHHQMIPLGHMNIPAWLFLQYNLIFYFMSICATVCPPLKNFFPRENDFISLSDLAEVEVVTIYKRSLLSLLRCRK